MTLMERTIRQYQEDALLAGKKGTSKKYRGVSDFDYQMAEDVKERGGSGYVVGKE